jgi:hypothetical protein
MSPHEHATISYGTQWKARLSKKHNALKPYVTMKSDCAGRYATIEQFGDLDLSEKTARHENTPAVELETFRVFMFPRSFNKKVKFDEDDGWKLDKIGVPMPQSAMRLMQAGERKMEEIIFAGMLGTATIGNGADEAMTTEALPASQEVAVNLTGSNTGLTSAKIKEGVRIFMDNDAWGQDSVMDGMDQLCLAASPKSLLNLWNEAVITSSDFRSFTGGKPFDTGILESFFGVKLLVTTGLSAYKTGNIQTIPMWLKSKVVYGDWKKAETDVWRDRDTGGDRIRFKFTGGAAREEAKGVVKIFADESV